MLKKALTQWSVNGAADINDGVMVIQNIDAFLLPKVDWLGGGLLLPEESRIVTPYDKIPLPVHTE